MLDRAKGPVGLMRGGQEFIPFVYDHFVTTLSKNNIFSISVREGVLGLFLSLRALREGTSGGPCRELILSLRNAACALLLLFVMAKAVAEAEAAFQLGTGLQEPGQGVHWRDWSSFRLSPSKSLKINNLLLRIQFREASKN